MWFDSHCHLQICEEDAPLDEVLERARSAGVSQILTLGTDLVSSRRCIELADLDGVVAGAGVHPNSAAGWDDDMADEVDRLSSDERVGAVGESGLDFYREHASPDDQEAAFAAHIAIAKRRDKSLVIHTRDSVDRTIELLERDGPPGKLVFHCWSAPIEALERVLSLGAYVGFAGNVTYKGADDLRTACSRVPDERLLVETDSPYLAPVPHRGKTNQPAFVAVTGSFVAALRGTEPATLARITEANARALFTHHE